MSYTTLSPREIAAIAKNALKALVAINALRATLDIGTAPAQVPAPLAHTKRKPGRPKKVAEVAPAKRKPGRPKKVAVDSILS